MRLGKYRNKQIMKKMQKNEKKILKKNDIGKGKKSKSKKMSENEKISKKNDVGNKDENKIK